VIDFTPTDIPFHPETPLSKYRSPLEFLIVHVRAPFAHQIIPENTPLTTLPIPEKQPFAIVIEYPANEPLATNE